ncbi:unnamed protein product [Mytilus edulis]|uniref:Endonuclease/exonuclease/phosphatase domain-containing protein n=1 Tax=Mytilus edulis TaxID=6550 RepID=A0A8S3QQ84_MYTED|nr:unnamed protein product [Mytilus edulis]
MSINEETDDLSNLPCHSTTISGLTDVNIASANDNMHEDVFEELKKVRSSNTSNLMCGYLNINSLRYKFECIKDLLHRNLVDILFLSETKIDESFPNAQFCVDNFTMWRADRNQHGDRKIQLEFSDVESIGIEAAIGNKKWFFCGIYKPPSMSDDHFSTDCTKTIDKIISKYNKHFDISEFDNPPKRPHNVPKRFYSSQARPRNLEKVNRGHLLRWHQFEEHFSFFLRQELAKVTKHAKNCGQCTS